MLAISNTDKEFFKLGTGNEARARIKILSNVIRLLPQTIPIEDFPLQHSFSGKQYTRQIFMPAGTLIVGKIHKHAHLNIVSRGKCIVATFEGEFEIDASNAPVTFESSAGTERVVWVTEDTYWTTIHTVPEGSNKWEDIEDLLVAVDYSDSSLPAIFDNQNDQQGEIL